MTNIVKVLLLMVFINNVNAQNPGYFGKKNVVDFSFNLQNPLFSNLRTVLNSDNKLLGLNGSNIKPVSDRLDWGFRFNYSRPLKRSFAIGLEFGYDYFSVQRQAKQEQYSSVYYYFQKIDINSMCIMPKLEFSSSGGLLPMGISHQVGFGVRIIKPVDKEYNVAITQGYQTIGSATSLPVDLRFRK